MALSLFRGSFPLPWLFLSSVALSLFHPSPPLPPLPQPPFPSNPHQPSKRRTSISKKTSSPQASPRAQHPAIHPPSDSERAQRLSDPALTHHPSTIPPSHSNPTPSPSKKSLYLGHSSSAAPSSSSSSSCSSFVFILFDASHIHLSKEGRSKGTKTSRTNIHLRTVHTISSQTPITHAGIHIQAHEPTTG
ncbi:hypothetical protein P154DRAFT_594615, partial [Amniculicola lignicola CBS 123094]